MRGLVVAFVLSSVCLSGAQTPKMPATASEASPTLHARANLVGEDIVATDPQGRPVRNLQASDFTMYEDGVPQVINGFSEHAADATALGLGPVPASNELSNKPSVSESAVMDVLLLDSLNTSEEGQSYLNDQLRRYIDQAKPGTRLAIFSLDTRLHLLQGFTNDSALLKKALASNGVTNSPLSQSDPNDLPVHEISEMLSDTILRTPGTEKVTGKVQSRLLDLNAREASGQTADRVRVTLEALRQLARYLSAYSNRKNLIWFSGGFPSIILRDPQTTGNRFAGNANLEDEIGETLTLLETSDVAISPVDARGLTVLPSAAPSEREDVGNDARVRQVYGTTSATPQDDQSSRDVSSEHATMQRLADMTGGITFYNNNALTEAIDKVNEAEHSYYRLYYTPRENQRATNRRELDVKVKEAGVHLAYRHEYFADLPQKPTAADASGSTNGALLLQKEMRLYTPDATEVLFTIRAQQTVSAASSTPGTNSPASKPVGENAFSGQPHHEYSLMVDLDPNSIEFSESPDGIKRAVIDFALVLYDAQGIQLASKVSRTALVFDAARYQAFVSGHMPYRFNIVLPADGENFVCIGVHDAGSDRIGTLRLSANAIRSSGTRSSN